MTETQFEILVWLIVCAVSAFAGWILRDYQWRRHATRRALAERDKRERSKLVSQTDNVTRRIANILDEWKGYFNIVDFWVVDMAGKKLFCRVNVTRNDDAGATETILTIEVDMFKVDGGEIRWIPLGAMNASKVFQTTDLAVKVVIQFSQGLLQDRMRG